MPRTTVYIVGDDFDTNEKVKATLASYGVNVQTYGSGQWRDGIENPYFRSQLLSGVPSLSAGSIQVENRGNVLPFPGAVQATGAANNANVQTMDQLESKAIENAILQFCGNLTEAARALGIGRATLYRKVKQYQIDPSIARKKRAA